MDMTSSNKMASPAPPLLEAPQVYIAATGTDKGRGVFAARAFAAGEIVERAPVILFEISFDELRRRQNGGLRLGISHARAGLVRARIGIWQHGMEDHFEAVMRSSKMAAPDNAGHSKSFSVAVSPIMTATGAAIQTLKQ